MSTLLTAANINAALDFYLAAGIIQSSTHAFREATVNKALRNKYTILDINYLIEEFEHFAFYYHVEEYGIAFMENESVYTYAVEQLVVDIAGFTADRFQPEPFTVTYDPLTNGTMSFKQGGVRFERALFAKANFTENLLQLCNEAIVANRGEAVLLAPLCMSDGETEAFVLLSAEHLQTAQRMGIVVSWYQPQARIDEVRS